MTNEVHVLNAIYMLTYYTYGRMNATLIHTAHLCQRLSLHSWEHLPIYGPIVLQPASQHIYAPNGPTPLKSGLEHGCCLFIRHMRSALWACMCVCVNTSVPQPPKRNSDLGLVSSDLQT